MNVFVESLSFVSFSEIEKAFERAGLKNVKKVTTPWVSMNKFAGDDLKVRGYIYNLALFKDREQNNTRGEIIKDCDAVIAFMGNDSKPNEMMKDELERYALEKEKPFFVHRMFE